MPNLVFHEVGHIILGVFGRFIGVLGGSLFQFAVPLILAGYSSSPFFLLERKHGSVPAGHEGHDGRRHYC